MMMLMMVVMMMTRQCTRMSQVPNIVRRLADADNLPCRIGNYAHNDIMMMNIDLDADKLTYTTLDKLRVEHHIDMTALSVSNTHGGNQYRTYVQMT